MSNKQQAVIAQHSSDHGSLWSYSVGFGLSIVLTLVAYVLTVQHLLPRASLILAIACLALLQLMVQLFFFLHLSQESRPRWRLVVFLFMIMVVAIIVFGSVWIMNNLNYNGMPHDLTKYMQQNEGL